MTTADRLLSDLRRHGIDLALHGDRIRYRPKDALTPALKAAITEHRSELLLLLALENPQVRWRADVMRPLIPPTGRIPTVFVHQLESVPDGYCLSCGELLTPGNSYRCEPCVQAVWLVLRQVRQSG